MRQYNIAQAKAHLSEIIRQALQGEDIVIARDNKPILRLTKLTDGRKTRQPGSAKGQVLFIAPDFDHLPADFGEYV